MQDSQLEYIGVVLHKILEVWRCGGGRAGVALS